MWAMSGLVSRELLSFGGAVVVHANRAELDWLFPRATFTPVALKGGTPEELAARYGRAFMLLKDHPDMAAVRWPLDRRDFLS